MSLEVDHDALKKLREPFTDGQVSKLPRPTFKDAWEGKPKARCTDCGGYHPLQSVIHLDYVGHAALTDRLLEADPEWTWEPLSLDERGLPAFDKVGGLWIRLTVGGVTRLGYGDSAGKSGPNAVKEAIGDALRNAGMRFGAALDLWHKGDLHDAQGQREEEPAPQRTELDDALDELDDAVVALKLETGQVASQFYGTHKKPPRQTSAKVVRDFVKELHDAAEKAKAKAKVQPSLEDAAEGES